jgi:aspartokinase
MASKRINNIREFVWKVINTDIAIKKDISRGILNIRALANYIITNYKIKASLDSVISAVRRYNILPARKQESDVFSLLRKAEIRSITKMASFSLKKNEAVTQSLGRILPRIDYEGGEVLRVLEGSKLFKILFDKKSYNKMLEAFKRSDIIDTNKNIGMIEMIYPKELEKTPGVFSVISHELAENDISIIDALICSNEHIVIVDEKDILKSFEVLYNLCSAE